MPLGIILTERAIVTISKVENDLLTDFVRGRVKGWSTAKRNRFVLQILLSTAQHYLFHLRAVDKGIDQLEDRLQQTPRNREVLELLKYQKSLVYFTTALRSDELMMERLQRSQIFKLYPDDEDLLDDVLIEIRQAIEMTGISNNILTQTVDAFGSIISNNLNVVVKLLTSMTIILTVPMLIASIYGMNVNLPFQDLEHGFWIVMAIALGTAGVPRMRSVNGQLSHQMFVDLVRPGPSEVSKDLRSGAHPRWTGVQTQSAPGRIFSALKVKALT